MFIVYFFLISFKAAVLFNGCFAEKDMGFLRIGSLNVRVKKTTEAFSNFLGVGSASINPIDASEKMHKGWGSADNITQVSDH